MSYRLLMLSSIPVHWDGYQYRTMDLWSIDLAEQVRHTNQFVLLCSVVDQAPERWTGSAELPDGIKVVDTKSLRAGAEYPLVQSVDVVQVHGGGSWGESRLARRLLAAARSLGVKSIVGISSNRARTALLNVRRPGSVADLARTVKSVARYASVNLTYKSMTSQADGTFIVGEGLRSLVSPRCRTLHVNTASWVQHADIVAARNIVRAAGSSRLRRLCIAARLERMKGVHVGIEAAALLQQAALDFSVEIYGAGAERAALEAQSTASGLSGQVHFHGTLSYPQPFLSTLGQCGVVLMTNLNDEQPRLVFDAISQGTLPLCPDTAAYRALGVPSRLRFESGNAHSLSGVIRDLWARSDEAIAADWETLFAIAEGCTLDSMHASRAGWIRASVLDGAKSDRQ